MARFAYDVNTRTRLIDVHKQFNGGLKTVDTDDALGSVYLRQAENVSLSEFGFIEKRYGTFEKDLIKTTSGRLQGYWEYFNYAIYAIDNKFYYKNSAGTETPVESILKETEDALAPETIYLQDWRYPSDSDLPSYGSNGFGEETEANPYRDMNAVNVNSVLYIFTGFYPVYVKLDSNDTPKFYWFSVTIPNYDEIVVTGHNLLENNYDNAYGYTTPNDYQIASSTFNTITRPIIRSSETNFHPQIPFVKDEGNTGSVTLEFKSEFPQDMSAYSTLTSQPFWEVELESVRYRNSVPGATTTAYTEVDKNSITFQDINNYAGSDQLDYIKEDNVLTTNLDGQDVSSSGPAGAVYTYEGTSYNYDQAFYRMNASFTIEKETLTKNNDWGIRVMKNIASDPANDPELLNDYDLSNAAAIDYEYIIYASSPNESDITFTIPAVNDFYYHLYPLNESGEIMPDRTLLFQTFSRSGALFRFNTDNLNNGYGLNGIYRDDDVKSYRIEFYHQVIRPLAYNTATLPAPTLTGNSDLYNLRLQRTGTKESQGTGNIITGSSIPGLEVSITDLITGRYDFEVTFRRDQYTRQNGILVYGGTDLFSGTAFDVQITPEKLQDFPGQTADFLPKLKPIWTCNKVMEHYGKLMVWGSKEMPTAIFYSFPDRPTYFPSKFYLDFTNGNSQPIEAVTPYMNILVAQTASQTWGIRGNSGLIDAPAPYVPFGINGTVGTIAYKSVRPVRNHLFFLSRQGVIALKSLYAADEQYNIEFVDRNIRNIVPQDSKAVGIQFDNQYWLNFPNNSITLRWYIDKKAWVKDVYQGYATNGFNGVFKYQIVDGKLEYITHPSTLLGENENEAIYKIGVDYDLPTDLHQPIKAKFETAFLNQNYPFHPKNYKEAKLDFTLQNEYNKGRLAIYDSSVDGVDATYSETENKISVTLGSGITLEKNHRYRVDFFLNPSTSETGLITYDPVNVTNIEIESSSIYVHDDVSLNTDDNTVIATEWMMTNDDIITSGNVDIEFTYSGDRITVSDTSESYVSIRDVTYDDTLTFDTYIISEDQTLNFNNYSGYDQASVDIGLDLTAKERLGDWTFGTSDFGKKITAVKTIKLSGKGYNAKLYLEDTSKSKWTLESMGITYKMRRARSR